MGVEPSADLEDRVLVLAPTGGDAELCRRLLGEAGLPCEICPDLDCMCQELVLGAGAILLTDQVLAVSEPHPFVEALSRQPPWSEIPIVLLAGQGADSPAAVWAMELLGNVTVLERPPRLTTLVSALRTALRARRRQYELRDKLDQLVAADRRKDEFLATLAHELRNPLAPILNSLHLLRVPGDDDRVGQRIRGILERQVHHLVRLVDDLLEVSRITLGKVELRMERIELSAVVLSAIETSRPLIEAKRHELRVVLPPEPVFLHADPVRIAQVISNLLNNAAKYTDDGGKVEVIAHRAGEEAVVLVRDSGIGIVPEMLPRVFDPFVQEVSSMRRAQGGLGIGLTLARTLVQMHRGRIEARSEGRGRGSEFIIYLPAVREALPAPSGTPHPMEDSRNGSHGHSRVLVVDDNRDAADCLGMVLGLRGMSVQVVYDGASALKEMREHRPKAVFLDIGMPDMDGHEVARRVRQDPELRDVVLIALTGWGQDEDLRRSKTAGFDHHLVKPLDLDSQPLRDLLASLEENGKS